MAVRFHWVKHDFLLGAPRFETFCVEEFFGSVPANSFRDVSPKRREFTELLPWVFARAGVDDGAEVRADVQDSKRVAFAVQAKGFLPHYRPVDMPFLVRLHVVLQDAGRLAELFAVLGRHSHPEVALRCRLHLRWLPLGWIPLGG